MSTTQIPVFFQRSSDVLIFALGAFLVAALAVLAARASERSALGPRARALMPWLVGGYLAVWLAAGLVVGDPRNLPPVGPELRPAVILAVGLGPMVLAAALLVTSRTLRTLNAAMAPESLIRVQAYRVVGLTFLFPFLYYGILPAAFAVPAAVGDFLTGLAAPFVAAAVARRRSGAIAWATAWNLFGIVDLVVAPAAAMLSGAPALELYPLVLIPLFTGPPIGILTHLLSLRSLAVAARRDGARLTTGQGGRVAAATSGGSAS